MVFSSKHYNVKKKKTIAGNSIQMLINNALVCVNQSYVTWFFCGFLLRKQTKIKSTYCIMQYQRLHKAWRSEWDKRNWKDPTKEMNFNLIHWKWKLIEKFEFTKISDSGIEIKIASQERRLTFNLSHDLLIKL